MHRFGGLQRQDQRPLGAGIDLDIGTAGQLADAARILFGQRHRHIAGDGRDADDLQLLRAGQRQQDGDGIVLAGIGSR